MDRKQDYLCLLHFVSDARYLKGFSEYTLIINMYFSVFSQDWILYIC